MLQHVFKIKYICLYVSYNKDINKENTAEQ
jgi:hypothetical protein